MRGRGWDEGEGLGGNRGGAAGMELRGKGWEGTEGEGVGSRELSSSGK